MSATTRLLVLGVVRLFQPVHGYEVRRELITWRAQELRRLSQANPFSRVGDGARAALHGDLGDRALVIGLVSAALLAVIGVAVATRTYQHESA